MQARFTEALMHNMAGVPIASEDIFSTTVSGQPKSEILIDLQREHLGMDKYRIRNVHFRSYASYYPHPQPNSHIKARRDFFKEWIITIVASPNVCM